MLKIISLAGVTLSVTLLSACVWDGTNRSDFWSSSEVDNNQLYPEGYETSYSTPYPEQRTSKVVVVPQTYHLGIGNAPVAAKDEDQRWVSTQNPTGYTIQVADDAKPAPVASQLQKIPKNARSAEVKSQSGTYLGLYGSYPTQEAAQEQLNTLPEEVKGKAQIKNWQTIQNEVR